MLLADSMNKLLNRDQGDRQVLLFTFLQVLDLLGKELDPARAPSDEHSFAFGGRGDPNDSTVGRVLRFDDQFVLLQGIDDPGHRWRPDLFGLRQLAQCDGAIENNHGQG